MNLPCFRTGFIAALAVLLFAGLVLNAQVRSATQTNSATRVAAEMTKGRLNPAESKPGDIVSVRLKDDLKSNGKVVLTKGTTISGVVRNVKRADTKTLTTGDANAQAQSLIEIEWLTPASEGRAIPKISIALQSITQTASAVHNGTGDRGSADDSSIAPGMPASGGARSLRNSGNSLPGEAAPASANPALLSMPFVVAVDHQTRTAIEGGLESPASGQLFKVGQGELMMPGGAQSVDLFSHLDNDTVIAASGKSFEISSGAQMQLLVGVHGAIVR